MKRPLFGVALCYVAGVLLAPLPVPLAVLFAVSLVLWIAACLWERGRLILLGVLIALAGWINLAERTAVLSPIDLRTLVGRDETAVIVRGVLRETPQRKTRFENGREIKTTTAQVEVTAINAVQDFERPATGRIVTTTGGHLPEKYFAGQTVEITGLLSQPKRPVAPGLFDYPAYLNHLGIYFQLRANNPDEWRIIASPAQPPLADRFCAWARKTLACGLPVEDETLHLEWALTLGWKAALTDEVSEPFIRAATYHIFAVDGLRIAIVAGILIGLLRVSGVPRAWCGLLVAPAIFFYASMTGWPASAVRAIVMIIVVFGGWALKRPSDLINSLFAAGLIILIGEPRQLFQAGFQLSFFVVLCIILILPFFENLGQRLSLTDPWLPAKLRPRWQKVLRVPAAWLLDLLLTSVAAWLGSIPLVAYYFHILTPGSGPANVLAVPLCGLVLICNLSSLLLGAWFPFASELFNHAGWFCMKGIQVTSAWLANWPGAWHYVTAPGAFTLVFYYLALLTVLTGWLFAGKWRRWKIAGLTLLGLVWSAQWFEQRSMTRMTILPLRGGEAVYVASPKFDYGWLIDCGDETSADRVLKPFLRAQGVNRLPNLLLTHGEAGYTGGAELICDLFQPRNIYTSALHFRSPAYREFKSVTHSKTEWQDPLQRGDKTGPWTVLQPDGKDHFAKGEDGAMVLRGEIDGLRILLLADLGRAGQRTLLERTEDLRADIVVAAVPGEGEPLNDFLLDAIQPRLIIIADSVQPATRMARATLKERLARRNVPVVYTSTADAVTLSLRRGRWDLEAMDGSRLSGLQRPAPEISSTGRVAGPAFAPNAE